MLPDNPSTTPEDRYMRLAVAQAELAAQKDEVPIGAVIVNRATGQVLAQTHNQTIQQSDPTAHAEILAIREACKTMGTQRIPECDLYVTLEPCPMCAAAISFARIGHVYYGADDVKSGGFVSGPALSKHASLHHKPSLTGGILSEISSQLLKTFFKLKR